MWAGVDYRFICVYALAVRLHSPYLSRVTNDHNSLRGGETMGYGVGGVGGYGGYGMGAAAFALVLFILLVIILRAGAGIY